MENQENHNPNRIRKDNRTVGVINLFEILDICKTPEKAFDFLEDCGVFDRNTIKCPAPRCGSQRIGKKSANSGCRIMRCKECRKEWSIVKGTFFDKSKTPINVILLVGYLFITRANWTQILMYTGLSENTVTDFIGFYRQLLSLAMDEDEQFIGGPGIVVEIDESKKMEAAKAEFWLHKNHEDIWGKLLEAFCRIKY